MSIQYVNQLESLSWSFSDCQEANGVSKESTCADNMKFRLQKIAQAVIKQELNFCHRSGKGNVWQLNGTGTLSFWPGVGMYFLIDEVG
jgi:hypothetical protein